MKRRKIRYSDERSVSACIEQLRAIIDGLEAGHIALAHDEGPVALAPGGMVNFELRVDQQRRKETLRLDLTWLSEVPDAAASAVAASGLEARDEPSRGPLSVPPASGSANGHANGHGHDDAGGLAGLAAGEYRELFAAARTRGSDGRWHIDQDRLVQSLALAGVDALTQQELYALALQADADGSAAVFNDRVIEALEQASQRPPPASAS
jgi:amphi-Trp domain-containing protein